MYYFDVNRSCDDEDIFPDAVKGCHHSFPL